MNILPDTVLYPERDAWPEILARPGMDSAGLEKAVSEILSDVKQNGDAAVLRCTEQFDKVKITDVRVDDGEFGMAPDIVSPELKNAIETALNNVWQFHQAQYPYGATVRTMPGVVCSFRYLPVQKVGLYIPGGSAPLFSTLLMLAIPAKIAGCERITVCTPPMHDGYVHPAILYICNRLGIRDIFKAGGVQAIGAMAYGTESIPAVYKIFGPGNQYVTCAKQIVSRAGIAIDMPAGPSEALVFADESCNPSFVASDLLSQAEHGPDSQVVLVTTSEMVADAVRLEIVDQLAQLPRKDLAAASLRHARFVLVKDAETAMDLINEYAPEHLILASGEAQTLSLQIKNAGSVFLGNYSPESAGDYASGTNHTLPTNGHAKNYSGVGVDSFMKKTTFQEITKEGLQLLAPAIERLAMAEGLFAHKNAVSIRLKKDDGI